MHGATAGPGVGENIPTNMLLNVLALVLCCNPVALIGVYYASQVKQRIATRRTSSGQSPRCRRRANPNTGSHRAIASAERTAAR